MALKLAPRTIMMPALILAHPFALVAVVGIGVAGCVARGAAYDPRHAAAAAAVGLVAAELATVPLLWATARRLVQADASQAALLATVVHLLVAGGGLMLLSPAKGAIGFTTWLFASYAATLVTVCVAAATVVRRAPVGPNLTPSAPAA